MVTNNRSRPPSRRKDTGGSLTNGATSQKYSTISATALNQLLQSPKMIKPDVVIVQEKPISERRILSEPFQRVDTDSRKRNDSQAKLESANAVTLPSIFNTNLSESKRDTLSSNATQMRNHNVLPEIPSKHSVRPLTPTDEFLHNKIRSNRGCSVLTEDEAQKRLRQKAILQHQIEEKRQQQEREEQEMEQKNREDEERIKREIAILNQRFEKERELEGKQLNKRQPTPCASKGSLEPISSQQLTRPPTPLSAPSKEPIKVSQSEISLPATTILKGFHDDAVCTSKEPDLSRTILQANDNKIADKLQNLTELCEMLMQEQQWLKSELEEQRRQTMLLLQERKVNEPLKQQLDALQEQLTLLTPHERAMLRIREHRRKHEVRDIITAPQKEMKQTVAITNVIESKLKKRSTGTRRRGSWATQSKAIAPAARDSISEPITEGEVRFDNDAPDCGDELGCSTKLVYPEDSVWHFDLCEPGVEGERSVRSTSRRSNLEEGDLSDVGRILSKPGMVLKKHATSKPTIVSKRRNGYS